MEEYYTKLFVNAPGNLKAFILEVGNIAGGEISLDTVVSVSLELDIKRNDMGHSQMGGPENDFLHFGFTIDVVNAVEMTLAHYLDQVGTVMTRLGEKGYCVVAACDWEEALPGRGRIVFE